MARFFLPPDAWGKSAMLRGDEARHLAQVLRIRAGESITVFDGLGRRASAEVMDVRKDEVRLTLGEETVIPALCPEVELALAIPKGKKMDLVVQKAVELGVHQVQPLLTRYTVVQPGEGKADKWQRIALEACKQSGLDHLPTISDPQPIRSWASSLGNPSGELRVIASLAPGARPLREVFRAASACSRVRLLVGPEGDFSDEETKLAIEAGFVPVTLGVTVLRAETASLFCMAAVRYEFES